MITAAILPDARRVITPAEASSLALDAHRLIAAYQLGTETVLRCSCRSAITALDERLAWGRWDTHCMQACAAFVAQLVDPHWLERLRTAAALLAPDDSRLDEQLAAQAALGDVTLPAADDSTAAWLESADPLDLDDADRQHPCGCLAYGTGTYGHQLGCAVTA